MCEFTVSLKGKVVCEGAIHVRVDGSRVTVKDVLGVSKVFEDCKIVELDVGSERLVLAPAKGSQ